VERRIKEGLKHKIKKRKDSQKKQNAAKSTFFAPPLPGDDPPPGDDPWHHDAPEQDPELDEENMPIFLGGVVPDEEIISELDADDEENDEDNDEDADFEIKRHANPDNSSVMKTYLKATQEPLRKETSNKMMNLKDKWLLELLKDDDWWIEAGKESVQ
jgi:hypothetical protein